MAQRQQTGFDIGGFFRNMFGQLRQSPSPQFTFNVLPQQVGPDTGVGGKPTHPGVDFNRPSTSLPKGARYNDPGMDQGRRQTVDRGRTSVGQRGAPKPFQPSGQPYQRPGKGGGSSRAQRSSLSGGDRLGPGEGIDEFGNRQGVALVDQFGTPTPLGFQAQNPGQGFAHYQRYIDWFHKMYTPLVLQGFDPKNIPSAFSVDAAQYLSSGFGASLDDPLSRFYAAIEGLNLPEGEVGAEEAFTPASFVIDPRYQQDFGESY